MDTNKPMETPYEDIPTKQLMEMAEHCDASACYELANRYSTGTTLLKRDLQEAKRWREQGNLYTTGYANDDGKQAKVPYRSMFLDENEKPYRTVTDINVCFYKLATTIYKAVCEYTDARKKSTDIHKRLEALEEPSAVGEPLPYWSLGFIILSLILLVLVFITGFGGLCLLLPALAYRYDKVKKRKRAIERYKEDLQTYKSNLQKLNVAKACEKVRLAKAFTDMKLLLHDGINVGMAIPFGKDFVNEKNHEALLWDFKELVRLRYEMLHATDAVQKRDKNIAFYNAKLLFLHKHSLRMETANDNVYRLFTERMKIAQDKDDMGLLRQDESTSVSKQMAAMEKKLSADKELLEDNQMSPVLERLDYVRGQEVSSTFGWTNERQLAQKTEALEELLKAAKNEYDELAYVNITIDYWLSYVRAYAYRNVYLGVELINFSRDNSGGRSLTTQKDGVQLSAMNTDMTAVTRNDSSIDMEMHIGNTINMVANALNDKDTRKWIAKNPKMAVGAVALNFVGGALLDKLEKHTEMVEQHSKFQKEAITKIQEIVDGYDSGQAQALRAMEIVKAIAKANKGFMQIYEPLREKVFDGGESLSMLDLQALAKATQEYKHISDSKL